MKKEKLIQIGLLLTVLGIWGFIGYRFFREEEEPVLAIPPVVKKKKATKAEGPYILMADYRDPFLDEMAVEVEAEFAEMPEAEPLPPPEPIPYQWPSMVFKGSMKNRNKEILLALITAEGKDILVKKGDHYGEIKIERIWKDSVLLSAGKDRLTLKK